MLLHTSTGFRDRKDIWIAIWLASFTCILLIVTSPHIGLTWDEPTYIVAAKTYLSWFEKLFSQPGLALSSDGVHEFWVFNSEHPPFSKVWSGFIWLGAQHIFDDLTAHRLGNILLVSGLIALLYWMVAQEFGRIAGLVAGFALLTMPRFFFHAHLAALDVPVAVMIFTVIYIFWVGHQRHGFRWTLLLGFMWGVAIATKINALFIIPIVLSFWTLIFRPHRYLIVRLLVAGLISIFIFILSWPWLYYNTYDRVLNYLGFMTTGRPFPMVQYYFGELYSPPPWHYPFVMPVIVVPITLVILFGLGTYYSYRNKNNRPFGGLLFLGGLISVLVLASGQGQLFDNDRLIMPAFPFIAALAGIGFVKIIPVIIQLASTRGKTLNQNWLVSTLIAITFGPHLILSYDLYPHLLSYYSEAIGGAYGAKVLRLETTYWCESYSEALEYLNNHAPPDAVVWGECQDVLYFYQLYGKLRSDLHVADSSDDLLANYLNLVLIRSNYMDADFVIIQYRQSGFVRPIREWLETKRPIHEIKYRSLRIAEIYSNLGRNDTNQ
jgi:4-amino-4-deoxy-L-arabinose transferase-like glycosyltransferase